MQFLARLRQLILYYNFAFFTIPLAFRIGLYYNEYR